MDSIPSNKHQFIFDRRPIVVDNRYDDFKTITYTKFGAVISAYDSILKKTITINCIFDAMEYPDIIKGTLNKFMVLKNSNHENIVNILDLDLYNGDLYIVTEYMETDINLVIRSMQVLTNDHYKFFMYQIIRGLIYIHSAGIIHGNLSARNILINSNCDLKLNDFRFAINDMNSHWSEDFIYDIDRFCAAPEIWHRSRCLTTKLDIWSAGCVFAFMLKRQPLFKTGDSPEFWDSVTDLLGSPSEDDLYFAGENPFKYINKANFKIKESWSSIFPNIDPLALDLLEKMLVINPCKRWDALKCINHPYFSELICEEEDFQYAKPFNFDYHDEGIKKKVLVDRLEDEVSRFRSRWFWLILNI